MEYSDNENDNENDELIDEILGPEDLFNDEADEEKGHNFSDEERNENNRNKTEKTDQDSKENIEKKKPKRVVKNPRVTLNFDTLKGPNGLSALKKLFENFKFKGNNHEQEDLTKIMGILQQWMCYQLCPSYDFESCMLQLEALGKKKIVQTHMKKYRLGMDEWGESKSDNEGNDFDGSHMEVCVNEEKEKSAFDLLLDEEIANADSENEFFDYENNPIQNEVNQISQIQTEFALTPEQLERIARNKKLAEERKLKRMNSQQEQMEVSEESMTIGESEISIEEINLKENS